MKQKSKLPKTSNPAIRALATIGVYHLEDLTIGPASIPILKKALEKEGLAFKS